MGCWRFIWVSSGAKNWRGASAIVASCGIYALAMMSGSSSTLSKPIPKAQGSHMIGLELYRAAVTEAWPEGDQRLELLQAAAWKLISERGPNEDKRRLKPDVDAPKDLLEHLEAVRERSGPQHPPDTRSPARL